MSALIYHFPKNEPQIIPCEFFDHTEFWTWGLALARQVLYHLNHTPSPSLAFFKLKNKQTFFFFVWYWRSNPGP
jgi:hypothetical protein